MFGEVEKKIRQFALVSIRSADDCAEPLSSKLPIPPAELGLYRAAVALRLVLLALFFQYRVTHPVLDAYGLWLTSVACEVWLALSWLTGQLPKLSPTNRVTYPDRLASRYVYVLSNRMHVWHLLLDELPCEV